MAMQKLTFNGDLVSVKRTDETLLGYQVQVYASEMGDSCFPVSRFCFLVLLLVTYTVRYRYSTGTYRYGTGAGTGTGTGTGTVPSALLACCLLVQYVRTIR